MNLQAGYCQSQCSRNVQIVMWFPFVRLSKAFIELNMLYFCITVIVYIWYNLTNILMWVFYKSDLMTIPPLCLFFKWSINVLEYMGSSLLVGVPGCSLLILRLSCRSTFVSTLQIGSRILWSWLIIWCKFEQCKSKNKRKTRQELVADFSLWNDGVVKHLWA